MVIKKLAKLATKQSSLFNKPKNSKGWLNNVGYAQYVAAFPKAKKAEILKIIRQDGWQVNYNNLNPKVAKLSPGIKKTDLTRKQFLKKLGTYRRRYIGATHEDLELFMRRDGWKFTSLH